MPSLYAEDTFHSKKSQDQKGYDFLTTFGVF